VRQRGAARRRRRAASRAKQQLLALLSGLARPGAGVADA